MGSRTSADGSAGRSEGAPRARGAGPGEPGGRAGPAAQDRSLFGRECCTRRAGLILGLGTGTREAGGGSRQAALSIWSTARSAAPGLPGSPSASRCGCGSGAGSGSGSGAGPVSSAWPLALRPGPRRGGLTGVGAAGPFRPERALRRLCTFSKPVRRSRRALDSTGSSSELSPPSASSGSAPGSGWSPGPRGCGARWKALAGMSASSCVWGTSADPEPHSSVTAGGPAPPEAEEPAGGRKRGRGELQKFVKWVRPA